MLEFLTWTARVIAVLVAIGAGLWVFGPYEPVEAANAFDPNALPDDLDAYLAQSEALVPNLRPGTHKRIHWHGLPGAQTDVAVVYIHGFSASSEEIRPVPDRVAQALGANLYFTRLTGHGQDGAAMATATAGAWLQDVAEAYAIGRKIGRQVLVISTSTGGTLAAATATDPGLSEGILGHVFVSPNFGLANPAGQLLSWPAARYWAPLIAGQNRSFEVRNEAHGAYWTSAYPTIAAMPMAAIVRYVAGLDVSTAQLPAMFLFSDADQVVSSTATREVAAKWGGPVQLEPVTVGPDDDPYSHVIAGDILSPGMTDPAVASITKWAQTLIAP